MFPLPLISLIEYLVPFCMILFLSKCYWVILLPIVILDHLAAFVMLQPWQKIGRNLITGQRHVFFLVIHLVQNVTNFMIWLLEPILSPRMLSSKSHVSLLNTGLLNPLAFLLSQLPIQCFQIGRASCRERV